MYLEIPQGSKINIQGLECCIPPEGYVYNIATKQLEHIGVYSRSEIPEEQYWERPTLPSDYNARRRKEKESADGIGRRVPSRRDRPAENRVRPGRRGLHHEWPFGLNRARGWQR